VRSHRRSASTIITGIAMPMTAKTMWKARDIAICERAAAGRTWQGTPRG
jgi:hypothetical protein